MRVCVFVYVSVCVCPCLHAYIYIYKWTYLAKVGGIAQLDPVLALYVCVCVCVCVCIHVNDGLPTNCTSIHQKTHMHIRFHTYLGVQRKQLGKFQCKLSYKNHCIAFYTPRYTHTYLGMQREQLSELQRESADVLGADGVLVF
jgi:hypothetical protein